MHSTIQRSIGLLSAALLATGALSGCSLLGGDDGDKDSKDAKASSSASSTAAETGSASPSSTESPSDASSDASSGETPADDLGDPAATRTGSADGQKVSLQVWPVKRSGSTAVLNFAMTVDPAAKQAVSLFELFGDANSDTGNNNSGASVDGVKLVDTENSKLYLVASDGAGNCVCTNTFSGASAQAGEVVNMSATFAAPPEDVTTVSVTVPTFGTFTDVPVS
jgi:hypothetical protein